jgi:hypothetical protein
MEIIHFNVGGMHYDVAKETLLKFNDTMLAKLIVEKQIKGSIQEPLFIDRNGERFQYILDWYRDGRISVPKTIGIDAVKIDALFFGLPENAIIEEANSTYDYMSSLHDTVTRLKKVKLNLDEMDQKNVDKNIAIKIDSIAIWVIREMLAKINLDYGIPEIVEVPLELYQKDDPFGVNIFVYDHRDSFVPAIQKIFANLGDELLPIYLTSVNLEDRRKLVRGTIYTVVVFTFSNHINVVSKNNVIIEI